ncbi:MAG TPA: hypothetical protein DCZ94_02475 [Lentisphaeria bacterium]|nr:MAG: hypothetical protein A2X48_21755 [Lentisphaerae bacterium GWF2_49_21]HBC85800.1 hypothetical protein [Lentisphaeria bacterium]
MKNSPFIIILLLFMSCSTIHVVIDPDTHNHNPFFNARFYAEQGPEGVKELLDKNKEGSYDRDVEMYVAAGLIYAPCDVYPLLLPYLSNEDPKIRAFAILVAGFLGDKRYESIIKKHLEDKTKLEFWFDDTVADRAETSLNYIEQGGFSKEERELIEQVTKEK